ncbi:MAG: SlyX family protein [Spirochaetia bacterium]|nr:SlyX family protein [Spirochaetia bacterium]
MENNNADSGFQTRMEMQTAFLERQLQELNETVLELNRRVDRAEKRIRQLTDRIEEGSGELNPNIRPPHY